MSAVTKRLSPFAHSQRRVTGIQVTGHKGLVARVLNTLFTWQARANERHLLGQLDERALKDMGLSRHEVLRELDKPFWRG